MFHVLCPNLVLVPARVEVAAASASLVTATFVQNKQEHVVAYELSEVFEFPACHVQLFAPCDATTPCSIPLPSPFNHTLKLGTTLLFCFEARDHSFHRENHIEPVDFVSLWNTLCSKAVTWQHHRPKKNTDALQKLGMPAKLGEFLREQVLATGAELPEALDVDEEDLVAEDETESTLSSTAESDDSSPGEEEYFSDDVLDEEDLEEEEEEEEDVEPEEIEDPDEED